jgi:hypothetical protein
LNRKSVKNSFVESLESKLRDETPQTRGAQ